jgi:phosphoserine phosphatase RsbU/P
VSTILSSAGRMARMINELLDFTRARLGNGIPMEPRPVDATEVIRRVLDECRVAHGDREFLYAGPSACTVKWDPERVAQVIANLLKNAVDYGDSGKPVSVTLKERDADISITIHNQGPAIPVELLAGMFDPFRRGALEVDQRSDGLGLGLYIVERIVTGHGGAVSVESTQETGTTFTVILPRNAAELPTQTA